MGPNARSSPVKLRVEHPLVKISGALTTLGTSFGRRYGEMWRPPAVGQKSLTLPSLNSSYSIPRILLNACPTEPHADFL